MKTNFRILFILTSLSILLLSCEEANEILNPDDQRSDYTGMWDVVETSEMFGTQNYEAEIFAISNDENILTIANFFFLGSWTQIEAEIDDDLLVIPLQTIEGYEIYGQGQVSNNKEKIDFVFTVDEVATTKSLTAEEVNAVFTKQ